MLGVEVHDLALPSVVRCPLCQRQALGVYKEPARPGQWYHCANCGFAGDGVELTAAVGEISLGSAILKLAARGLAIPTELLEPVAIEKHTKKAEFRKRVMAFWNAARASTHDSGSTGPRSVDWASPRRDARSGMAPSRRSVHRSLHGHRRRGAAPAERPELPVQDRRNEFREYGWTPLFSGRGWRDLLVVAYHDVPGRVSGFMLVGREANWPDDFVFLQAVTHQTGTSFAMGVLMFEATLAMHREFGSAVFVVEDPVLAVPHAAPTPGRHGYASARGRSLGPVGGWLASGQRCRSGIWSTGLRNRMVG